MTIKSSILAGISDEGLVKEIRMNFVSSSIIRKRIRKLLQDKEESSVRSSLSKDGYDTPNWALKQADSTGYIRALREVASLLED